MGGYKEVSELYTEAKRVGEKRSKGIAEFKIR